MPPRAASPATPTHKRFALGGRSHDFDPRVDAARGDLADLRLADRLFAPHYAAAVLRTVIIRTPLLDTVAGAAVSELLPGETFEVLELSKGHAWGTSPVDGAVGFANVDALGPHDPNALPQPEIADDFVAVAERLVGISAQAGGRSDAGVDGGGLIFFAFAQSGIRVPRFIDLQATIGHAVGQGAPMIRGDLIFFDGSVAIIVDDVTALHVTDAVVLSPIAELGAITAHRRLP